MIRLGFVILLLFSVSNGFAQNVTDLLFQRGVDYINCQITKTSLADQIGQTHLEAYRKEVEYNCRFEKLVEFLKTQETGVMTQNLELSFFINSYKEKYNPELSDVELFSILMTDLFKEAPIQNFKIKHAVSFLDFESDVNDYLITVFSLNKTTAETIEEGMGEVVMVEEGEEEQEEITPSIPSQPKSEIRKENQPMTPRPNRYVEEYSPFDFDEGEEVFSWSSWLFRFSLLFASLAVLLWVLLPYYEKREKAKVKKPGDEVHPMALSLEAEVSILENNNRILKEKIRKIHLDLDDYEDTFKSA
jgi:hypothetical protein